MARTRKRKTPVVSASEGRPLASANKSSSRAVIRRFHYLLRSKVQLEKQKASPANSQALAEIDQEIANLGGLDAYQKMSTIGQGSDRGGGSEKVFIQWLKEEGLNNIGVKSKVKLLEVGALKPDNYASCSSWIEVTPIDLHSQHPSIREQDFLQMDEVEHAEKWDLISLSLVLNFVPDAHDRGRMLRLARTMLRPDGLLFLALPLPCVRNSRYLTMDHLRALMNALGFAEIKSRWKDGGKMAYWLYRKSAPDSQEQERFRRKTVLLQGKRNNYAILL
ncbi:hypothetical protein GLOTRDRAFT_114713 [Gloeophyllum trabeum ATCC 11539]|uniref:25S rRNA adenine-N(1) methyltransferase n=1 Tax=Gloeophyllum trabeum (strain ATCC 11539 / FP-39264 / Madison 617) TaxID=670483 RepID=S7QGE0_GLOTA|nr:uncharacterized protein GLOTRDRAFT_114713 [Gloeophyllum trabeum ATCC 11539]EPQ58248.1 hypothetical protein GLOTRDRAFT_114713 [Gloeophyllum trabeum ATCC 11539]